MGAGKCSSLQLYRGHILYIVEYSKDISNLVTVAVGHRTLTQLIKKKKINVETHTRHIFTN